MTRGILVFTLASLVSWGAGAFVDLFDEKVEKPQAAMQQQDEISQLLKAVN